MVEYNGPGRFTITAWQIFNTILIIVILVLVIRILIRLGNRKK